MKKRLSKLTILAAAGLFSTSTSVSAHHLLAPASVLCPLVGDLIQADWADVEGATKYSVNVIATYDTGISGDPTDDTSMDWDFGTGDRMDGLPMSQSDLMIPLSALIHDFGTGAGRTACSCCPAPREGAASRKRPTTPEQYVF